ncbi:MAG: DNA polymerase III subunit delta' [Xanthomonadales bacterium]|nr:DNA polymerase III subunit delta' [Xanthomonadales bacterium]
MSLPPWLAAAWPELGRAVAEQRLHHALLLAAPEGLGKRELAAALVAAALCTARMPEALACGQCRACTLLAAGSHPDLVRVGLELRDDGKPRTEVTVDQLRALSQRLALSSQFGGLQLALIDPADRMNASAANALLKTLEEPSRGTIMVLVADDASRLPATIRSRCRRVEIAAPGPDEALHWLLAQGVANAAARDALAASLGNPGRALAWARDGALELRQACAGELAALGAGTRMAAEIAERWAGDRPELRLWMAAVLARDEARALAAWQAGVLGLTDRDEIPKLAAWADRANRARGLLATTLRTELVLLDLLRAWPRGGTARRRI